MVMSGKEDTELQKTRNDSHLDLSCLTGQWYWEGASRGVACKSFLSWSLDCNESLAVGQNIEMDLSQGVEMIWHLHTNLLVCLKFKGKNWLVVTGTWRLFSHILGISSSQLTFILFRGVGLTELGRLLMLPSAGRQPAGTGRGPWSFAEKLWGHCDIYKWGKWWERLINYDNLCKLIDKLITPSEVVSRSILLEIAILQSWRCFRPGHPWGETPEHKLPGFTSYQHQPPQFFKGEP